MKTIEELEALLEAVTRERDEARERNTDMRKMLEQVTRDRDHIEESVVRLETQRDEAIKARDQYLRERDQARMAEKRARESLDELDGAIYDCLPSDYDDDSPLDCVEHAADRLRDLAEEREEARAEVERLREESATQADISSSTIARMKQQLREALADVQRLSDASTHWQVMLKRETEEVERLARQVEALTDERDEVRSDAFRRGAEAMREACARWMSEREGIAQWVYDDALSALPIPEEP